MDLMSGTYSYETLQSKYKNFTVPAAKLLIGGSDVLGIPQITVSSLSVSLSLNAAGSATFSMNGSYDYKNSSFDQKLKSKAVLGKPVEVELGYGSDCLKIFKGFLASLDIDFDVENGISYSVTAFDARYLMMTDNKRVVNHKVTKNYSEAVDEILKRYSKLCKPEVDATNDHLENAVLAQNSSDYDFIMRDLIGSGKTDREFFIVGDRVYFRKPRGSKTAVLKLGIGKGLKSFRRSPVYLNQKIRFLGREEGNSRQISGEAVAKSKDEQVSALSDAGLYVETAADCRSADKLRQRAENRAAEQRDRNNKASATTVGLPELVPGRYVQIDGVDKSVNGKYYVTSVTHSYSPGGFTTSLELEGGT